MSEENEHGFDLLHARGFYRSCAAVSVFSCLRMNKKFFRHENPFGNIKIHYFVYTHPTIYFCKIWERETNQGCYQTYENSYHSAICNSLLLPRVLDNYIIIYRHPWKLQITRF